MKRTTNAGERAGIIEIDEGRVRYVREDGVTVEGSFDVVEIDPGCYSVLIDGRSYRLPKAGSTIQVFDPRGRRAGRGAGADKGRREIQAPMPGKVVRVLVEVGEAVSSGQGLVVVEAMKMQNELKSPLDGKVAEVRAKVDATVNAGEVLLVVEA